MANLPEIGVTHDKLYLNYIRENGLNVALNRGGKSLKHPYLQITR